MKVSVGFLTYNSDKYLPDFLESLVRQSFKDLEVLGLDNGSTELTTGGSRDDSAKFIQKNYPQIKFFQAKENLGFSKGHNFLINVSRGEYYLCLNPDVLLELNFIEELARVLDEKPKLGSVGGKLKYWDFKIPQPQYQMVHGEPPLSRGQEQQGQTLTVLKGSDPVAKEQLRGQDDGKTDMIDSLGLKFKASHCFEDLAQGDLDRVEYNQSRQIFGPSGAAALYRRKALDEVVLGQSDCFRLVSANTHNLKSSAYYQFFDENMFAYKEDIDLAYRLQWTSWKSWYQATAVAYHHRSAMKRKAQNAKLKSFLETRKQKSRFIKKMSTLNHLILLSKNFSWRFSWKIKISTVVLELGKFCYLLLREPYLLRQYWKFWSIRKKLHISPKKVGVVEIEKLIYWRDGRDPPSLF